LYIDPGKIWQTAKKITDSQRGRRFANYDKFAGQSKITYGMNHH